MAWQNLLDYDPGTVFQVLRNGVLIPPEDYAANSVVLDVTAGRATLTYPLSPFAATWELQAVPSAPVSLQMRALDAEADPGTNPLEDRFAYAFIDHVNNPDDDSQTINGLPPETVTFPIAGSAALALGVGIVRQPPT